MIQFPVFRRYAPEIRPEFILRVLIGSLLFCAMASLANTHSHAQALFRLPAGGQEQHPSQATPVAVFGTDNRISLPADLAGLRDSIGLLTDNRTNSICTGFCVAGRVVATAAHCLFPSSGERRPALHEFKFTLFTKSGPHSGQIAGARNRRADQYVIAGSRNLRVEPPIDAARDWALLRLDKPICAGAAINVVATPPPLVEELANRGQLIQVGFHNDYEHQRLAYSQPCSARAAAEALERARIKHDFSDARALLLHSCDSGGTSSGSPLLLRGDDGRFSAAAINIGTYVQTRMQVERGRIIKRFRSKAIANTAVSVSAFADLIGNFSQARIVDARPQIRALQKHLSRLGHYHAAIDGTFGPHTRNAIQAYRGDYHSLLAGLPTLDLLHELQGRRHVRALASGHFNGLRHP